MELPIFQPRKISSPKAKAGHTKLPKAPKASKATSAGSDTAAAALVVPDLLESDFHLPSLPDDWVISGPSRPAPRSRFNPGSFVLRSGTYDILLIVDAMEVTGGTHGGKKNRKLQTLEELEALQVGQSDFCSTRLLHSCTRWVRLTFLSLWPLCRQ